MREIQRQVAVVVLMLTIVLSGCGAPDTGGVRPSASGDQHPAAPKRITAAIMSNPKGFFAEDALTFAGTPGADVLADLVHGGLIIRDGQGSLRAQLAEAVPSLDNGLWKLLPGGRMETTARIASRRALAGAMELPSRRVTSSSPPPWAATQRCRLRAAWCTSRSSA
jgi:hypothetical protein